MPLYCRTTSTLHYIIPYTFSYTVSGPITLLSSVPVTGHVHNTVVLYGYASALCTFSLYSVSTNQSAGVAEEPPTDWPDGRRPLSEARLGIE